MINFNGTLTETPQFSAHNRGMLYGDAVFETIRYSGGKLFFWEDHYFRLMASMRILRMEIPMHFTLEDLQDELLKLIDAEGLKDKAASVRLTVLRNGLNPCNGIGYKKFVCLLQFKWRNRCFFKRIFF